MTDEVAIGKEATREKLGETGLSSRAQRKQRGCLKQRNQALARGKVAGELDCRVSGRNFLLCAVHQGVKEAAARSRGLEHRVWSWKRSSARSRMIGLGLAAAGRGSVWIPRHTTPSQPRHGLPDQGHVTQPQSPPPALARAFSEAHTKYSIRTHSRNITTSTIDSVTSTTPPKCRYVATLPPRGLWAISALDFDFRRLREIRLGPEEGYPGRLLNANDSVLPTEPQDFPYQAEAGQGPEAEPSHSPMDSAPHRQHH